MQAHRIYRKSRGPHLKQMLEPRQLQKAKKPEPQPLSSGGAVARTQPSGADMATPARDTPLPPTTDAGINNFNDCSLFHHPIGVQVQGKRVQLADFGFYARAVAAGDQEEAGHGHHQAALRGRCSNIKGGHAGQPDLPICSCAGLVSFPVPSRKEKRSQLLCNY